MTLVEKYKDELKLYQEFGESLLVDLSSKVVNNERLNVQQISGRLKDPTSLQNKVSSDSKYKELSDVTDLVGLRIIVTYRNEIPFIISQIKDAFEIDEENTNTNDPKSESEFGYSSYHVIISNAKVESFKSHNLKFKNLKAEVQIRTILQHAWADISHMIDYKAKHRPESNHRRKLFRVAALLELADQEFGDLREEIVKSQKDLIPRDITQYPDIEITPESLQAFVMESDSCNALDQRIANITDSTLHFNDESIIGKNLMQIRKLEISTLKELDEKMRDKSDDIVQAFEDQNKTWIEFRDAFPESHGNSTVPRGVAITYLYFLIKRQFD